MSIDSQSFKEALSQFASGVTVVTTHLDGRNFGLTVSAFTSLSLDPPLVLVCLDRRLQTHKVIEKSKIFAVNILGEHQLEFGKRFAGLRPEVMDRFEGLECAKAVTGSPILPECLGWIDCSLWRVYEGGDHSIFVGEVLASSAVGLVPPLLYHNRDWRRSADLDQDFPIF